MAKKKPTRKKQRKSPRQAPSVDNRRQDVQQAVKAACDQLNSDGVDPRDYVEQLAWLFFLKAFDEMESRREEEAAFEDESYSRRLSGNCAWSSWSAMTNRPDEMLKFVNAELWEKLHDLGGDSVAERFRRIFSAMRSRSKRGTSFTGVISKISRGHFSDTTGVIILSEIYENPPKQVAADSAGDAGDYVTEAANSRIGRESVLRTARRATGTANTNTKGIRRLEFPLPPLRLVQKARGMKRNAGEVQRSIGCPLIHRLRESILRKAFAGEL